MKKIFLFIYVLIVSLSIYAVDNAEFELGNAKKLLFETNRILNSSDNKMVVSEISDYDWFFVNDLKTSDYINRFHQLIKETKLIQQKKERLDYMYNQKKSLQMTALVPNALNLINVAVNARDPLKAMIAIGGTAASSASQYLNQKQKDELELLEQKWKLDDMQTETFANINTGLREYLARISKDYGFSNEDFNSPQTLSSFIKDMYENDANRRFNLLSKKQYRDELKNIPEYWAELAKASYEINKYNETLDYISKYENVYVQTMYHDERYANIMQIKAYCILKLNIVSEFDKLSDIADKILKNSNQAEWVRKYFCVELYKTCYEKTDDFNYLIKAKDLLREVLQCVLDEYKTDVKNFYDGSFIRLDKAGIDTDIEELTELRNSQESYLKGNKRDIGKQERKKIKSEISGYNEQIDQLKDNKKQIEKLEFQFLPPNSTLLYSLANEYFNMDQIPENNPTQFDIIKRDLSRYLISDYYQERLFDKAPTEKNIEILVDYNKRILFWNKDDILKMSIPASYFTFTDDRFDISEDKLYIIFNDEECELNYSYEFKRGKEVDLSDSKIIFTVKTGKPIKVNNSFNKDDVPIIKIVFKSNSMPYKEPINVRISDSKDLMKMFNFDN